jgi:hypothetical protein
VSSVNAIHPDRNIHEAINSVTLPMQVMLIQLGTYLRQPSELWRIKIAQSFEECADALKVALGEQQQQSSAPVGRPRLKIGSSSPAANMEVLACLREAQAIVVAALQAWLTAPSGATKARLETARRREADLFYQLGHQQPTKRPVDSVARGKVRTRPTKAIKSEIQDTEGSNA